MHLEGGSEARQSLSELCLCWAGVSGCLFSTAVLFLPSFREALGAFLEPFYKGGNPFAESSSCRESTPTVGL